MERIVDIIKDGVRIIQHQITDYTGNWTVWIEYKNVTKIYHFNNKVIIYYNADYKDNIEHIIEL